MTNELTLQKRKTSNVTAFFLQEFLSEAKVKNIDDVFRVIETPFVPTDDYSLAQQQLAIELNNRYYSATPWLRFWVLQEGNINRKPLNTPRCRRQKAFAKFMLARKNLVTGVHEVLPQYFPEDPLTYWLKLELELKFGSIEENITDRPVPLVNGKSNWLENMRSCYKQLENRKNPFSDDTVAISFYNFIEAGCSIAEKHHSSKIRMGFQRDYWNPLVVAFRDYYLDCKKNSEGILFCSNGKLLATCQGRPRTLKLVSTTWDFGDFIAEYHRPNN